MRSDDTLLHHLECAAVAEEAAATLRHDLRNKLASIRNAAFYLRRRLQKTEPFETDPRVSVFFKLIDDELVAAERLTAEPSPLHHLFDGCAAPTRLEDVVPAALAAASPPPEIRIVRSLAETQPIVANPLELVLLLRLLIDNAVEAMPDGGTLLVNTRKVDRAAVLEVVDSGGGNEAPDPARAFEPFVSTKMGHAGIGLNVARRIAERYAGRLDVEFSPAGTHARVSFPRAEELGPAEDAP